MFKAVVPPDANITIVKCKFCRGVILCIVDQYLEPSDITDIEKYRALKHKVVTTAEMRSTEWSCRCDPETRDKKPVNSDPNRPVLSLKKKQ